MDKVALREATLRALRDETNAALADVDDDFEDFDDDVFI